MPELVERLEHFPAGPPPVESAHAAVTAVLREARGKLSVLLIQRTERDGDPGSGQVALPGGHREPEDHSLLVTALRELNEEVGITPRDLASPLRYFGTYAAAAFGVDVAAFVTQIRPGAGEASARDPEEVDSVFWLPLRELHRVKEVPRTTSRGEISVEAVVFEGHVLWGFTRRVLLELLHRLPTDS